METTALDTLWNVITTYGEKALEFGGNFISFIMEHPICLLPAAAAVTYGIVGMIKGTYKG